MKALKHIVVLGILFTFLGIGTSFSQASKTGVRIMPQAGFNLTRLTDEPMVDSESFRLGIEGGFWLQSKKTVFIMPGVFIAQQGLSSMYIDDIQTSGTSVIDTVLNKVDYRAVKFPLMLGVQALGARIYTGPSFTYILNTDNPDLVLEEFKDLTMGLCVGAGFHLTLLSVDVRYEYGVSNLFLDRNAAANTLTVSAGLKF